MFFYRKWEWDGELLFLQKNIEVAEGLEGWGMTIGTAMCRIDKRILQEGKITSDLASDILNLTGKKFAPDVLESLLKKLTNLEIPLYITNMKEALSKRLFPPPTKKALVTVSTTVNSIFYGELRPEYNSLKMTRNTNGTSMSGSWLKRNMMNDPTLFSRLIRALYFRRHTFNLYKQNEETIPHHVIQTMLVDIYFKRTIPASSLNTHMNFCFFLVKYQWEFIKEWFVYLENVFKRELVLGIFLNDLKCPALDLFSCADRLDRLQDNPKYQELSEGVAFTDETSYHRYASKTVSVVKSIGDDENEAIEEFLIKESDVNKVKQEHIKRHIVLVPGPKVNKQATKKRKVNTDLSSKRKKKRKVDDNNNGAKENQGQLAKNLKKKQDKRFTINNFALSPNSIREKRFSFSSAVTNNQVFSNTDYRHSDIQNGSKMISSLQARATTNCIAVKDKNRLSPVAELDLISPEMSFGDNDKDRVSLSPGSTNFQNLRRGTNHLSTGSQPENTNDKIIVSVIIENKASCSSSIGEKGESSPGPNDSDQQAFSGSSGEDSRIHSSSRNVTVISSQEYFNQICAAETIGKGVSSLTIAEKENESSSNMDCDQNPHRETDKVLGKIIGTQSVNKDVNADSNAVLSFLRESSGGLNMINTTQPTPKTERMKELMKMLRDKVQADLPSVP